MMKWSEKSGSSAAAISVLALLALAAYFAALGFNDIWTPNEGFYADAAREMLATNNFLDIYYNSTPRFNKPPMMYWLIALAGKCFGLDAFSVRLPSALAGIGTVWLVFLIGRLLESRVLGLWAALVMTFSFQFVINARYGTPEIVLTFFFTLTLYLFLWAFQEKRTWPLFFSYVSLGLAALTKGYPYFIVIEAIILIYLFFDAFLGDRQWAKRMRFLRLARGLPVALLIGMAWVGYMVWHYGSGYWEVFLRETYHRAFTRESAFKPFFYLEASTWGFLPYSIVFFGALIWLAADRFRAFMGSAVVRIGLVWFIVMLVVFTLAKGKIPTYFIQAHPAMSLITAFFIVHFRPARRSWQHIGLQFAYGLPGMLFFAAGFLMVWKFEGGWGLYFLAFLPLVLLLAGQRFGVGWFGPAVFPYSSFAVAYLIFAFTAMPFMEQFRPHRELGRTIVEMVPDTAVPVMVEGFHLHSLPFYAGRKIWQYSTGEMIREYQSKGPVLLLVKESQAGKFGSGKVLWRGYLYGGSESRTLEFLLDCMAFESGKPGRFVPFVLLYQSE